MLLLMLAVGGQMTHGGDREGGAFLASRNSGRDISVFKEAQHSISLGVRWVREQQRDDGSWCSSPFTTGLVIAGILCADIIGPAWARAEGRSLDAVVDRGIRFIIAEANADGSIGPAAPQPQSTAACMIALVATGQQRHAERIAKGRRYLISLEWNRAKERRRQNLAHEAVQGSTNTYASVFDLQWALEALRVSKAHSEAYRPIVSQGADDRRPSAPKARIRPLPAPQAFLENALRSLARCQNIKRSSDSSHASGDGGFFPVPMRGEPAPGEPDASATYAGLKGLLQANVSKDDPRVKAACEWIRHNYSLAFQGAPKADRENSFFGYFLMAKALGTYGELPLTDAEGNKRDWREDLIVKLTSLQNGEGYWDHGGDSSQVGRATGDRVLSTAYCLLALEVACADY